MFFALLLMVTGASAQKIDTRLTDLVNKSAAVHANRASARSAANREAFQKKVKENYNVDFNNDGSVRMLGVTAYLKKGAECPTTQLEANGITVRSTFDNVAFLAVPADKLSALEAIDDIILAVPEGKMKVMNMEARTATKADKAGTPIDATAAGLPQAYAGDEWTLLSDLDMDRGDDAHVPGESIQKSNVFKFNKQQPQDMQYFRLEITKNFGSSAVQLNELIFNY